MIFCICIGWVCSHISPKFHHRDVFATSFSNVWIGIGLINPTQNITSTLLIFIVNKHFINCTHTSCVQIRLKITIVLKFYSWNFDQQCTANHFENNSIHIHNVQRNEKPCSNWHLVIQILVQWHFKIQILYSECDTCKYNICRDCKLSYFISVLLLEWCSWQWCNIWLQ